MTDWEGMWKQGLEPGDRFDCKGPAPALLEILDEAAIPSSGTVLVPGCGRAYDVAELSRRGLRTIGIDIAPSAVAAAKEFLEASSTDTARAEVREADFFRLTPEDLGGPLDVAYDYTFLCAIDPSMRDAWAKQYAQLLKPEGKLVTLIYPIMEREGGPPFQMSVDLVKGLLEPHGFRATVLRAPRASHEGREGHEIIAVWTRET